MISYSNAQHELADQVHGLLKAAGHAPRLDRLDIAPGERFRRTLAWWLSACHAAVVLLSRDALESPWVRYELSVLVTRQLVNDDVRLMLLYLDGLTPADVAQRLDLAPLALPDFQGVAVTEPVTDADLARILVDGLPAATGQPLFEQLVSEVAGEVKPVATGRLAAARAHLLHLVAHDPDPWFDDAELADRADEGTALRWALAREMCSVPLPDAYGALQALAGDCNHSLASSYRLVDLILMTTVDAGTTAVLREGSTLRSPCVVLALTTTTLAKLATAAVELCPGTLAVFTLVVLETLAATTPEGNADLITKALGLAAEELLRDEPDPLDAIGDLGAVGHPVFVVLARPQGITTDILRRALAQIPPGVTFVIPVTRDNGPEWWRQKLAPAVVAGLDVPVAWDAFVTAEEGLVDECTTTRDRLRLVHLLSKP